MKEAVYHSSQSGLSFIIFALCSRKCQTSHGMSLISVSSTLISVMAASRRPFMILAFHFICFSCGFCSARGRKNMTTTISLLGIQTAA